MQERHYKEFNALNNLPLGFFPGRCHPTDKTFATFFVNHTTPPQIQSDAIYCHFTILQERVTCYIGVKPYSSIK